MVLPRLRCGRWRIRWRGRWWCLGRIRRCCGRALLRHTVHMVQLNLSADEPRRRVVFVLPSAVRIVGHLVVVRLGEFAVVHREIVGPQRCARHWRLLGDVSYMRELRDCCSLVFEI
eukprot:2881629-Prymnesium_polylepis.1